jgi:NTP pyrophosphatase (non-canonical NTP hydrolase)
MNQQTIDRIIAEHKKWTKHNFDYEAPHLGLMEEVGEFAHQLLKAGQKIRVTSNALRADALADMVVFYFHLCWKYEHRIYDAPCPLRKTVEWHLATLSQFAGKIAQCIAEGNEPDTIYMAGVWDQIKAIASLEEWDMEVLVCRTWDSVKKRDFRLYPGTGLPPELPAETITNRQA